MPLNESPVTLLIVDDEEAIRSALKRFLVQQGYETVTADSGEQALEILARQKITGMLLDVQTLEPYCFASLDNAVKALDQIGFSFTQLKVV